MKEPFIIIEMLLVFLSNTNTQVCKKSFYYKYLAINSTEKLYIYKCFGMFWSFFFKSILILCKLALSFLEKGYTNKM